MAGNLTDVAETLILDWIALGTTPTRPSALEVRLMITTGDDDTPGTEVTGGSYTPQTVTFSAASSGATSNSADLTFTEMPACTVTGVEIWDTETSARRLWYGDLAASKTVNDGDTFVIAAGDLTLSLD
jgi:hypothetical protein